MKKLFRMAAVVAPVILTAGSVGVYLAVATHESNKRLLKGSQPNINGDKDEEEKLPEDSYSKFKIFPDLDQHDFYNAIKINKLKAIIDEEMQAKIINYVFRHVSFTEGNISFSIEKISDTNIKFYFKWISPDGFPHHKTYNFVITDSSKK